MTGPSSKNVLIISPEPWGSNRLSKHHYALELHEAGYNVFFLNPPGVENKKAANDNIQIIDYTNPYRGINKLPSPLRNLFNKRLIKKINRIAGIDTWRLVWTFDPFRFQNLTLFNAKNTIFYSADIHKTNLDILAATSVDVVLAPSQLILNKYKPYCSKCTLLNHGLAKHFVEYEFSAWHKRDVTNVIYLGNLLNRYIDTVTLEKIVRQNPHLLFTFIGPYEKSNLSSTLGNSEFLNILKSLPNVKFLGSIPSKKLPKYLDQADLFFICYDSDMYRAEVSNSHKIIELLSTGRAIVSNYFDEYNGSELLEMAVSQKELPNTFEKVASNIEKYNALDLSQKRRAFALQNSYTKQLKKILELLGY